MRHRGYGFVTALCGAEMRLRVKEHVVKKKNSHELPKNIRQVGDLDLDKRVYIEDYQLDILPIFSQDGKCHSILYISVKEENTIKIRKYKSSYLCPLLYHIANRLLNQFVNFLNMEIQMI